MKKLIFPKKNLKMNANKLFRLSNYFLKNNSKLRKNLNINKIIKTINIDIYNSVLRGEFCVNYKYTNPYVATVSKKESNQIKNYYIKNGFKLVTDSDGFLNSIVWDNNAIFEDKPCLHETFIDQEGCDFF